VHVVLVTDINSAKTHFSRTSTIIPPILIFIIIFLFLYGCRKESMHITNDLLTDIIAVKEIFDQQIPMSYWNQLIYKSFVLSKLSAVRVSKVNLSMPLKLQYREFWHFRQVWYDKNTPVSQFVNSLSTPSPCIYGLRGVYIFFILIRHTLPMVDYYRLKVVGREETNRLQNCR
jgi:hypothetical protein